MLSSSCMVFTNWRAAIVLFFAATSFSVHAQVPLSAGPYSQTFDSLGTNGTSIPWSDNSTLPGWYASKTLGGRTVTNYVPENGSSSAGEVYSFGDDGSADRALGSISSGTPGDFAYGVRFINDTAVPRGNFLVTYTGEQWRVASTNLQRLEFSYRVSVNLTNSDAANTQNWTRLLALDFTGPNTNGVTQLLKGNDPTNRLAFVAVPLPGVVVPAGQELFLRWFDTNDTGFDDGLAIDDVAVSFTETNLPPPPAFAFSYLHYNVNGNGASTWSTNATQVQAIGRELVYMNADIMAFNEIPNTKTFEMPNWVKAFFPGYYLATNSATDGSIRSVIASRYPITRSQSWLAHVDLNPFGYTPSDYTRDLFEAQISVPGLPLPLHVFTTHLKATSGTPFQDDADKRAAEAKAVSNFFAQVFLPGTNGTHPYILSGDLNEDIFRPETNVYATGHPIEQLIGATTGLRLTTPTNPITGEDFTESIRSTLDVRFDYILPCNLLSSNIVSSTVLRTDVLDPLPAGLNANDDIVASDHLPVLMYFANPYDTPFRLHSLEITGVTATLNWESTSNRVYRIEVSSNLTTWTVLASNITATGTNTSYGAAVDETVKFFRVYRIP